MLISTAAPAGLEQAFLANATNQYSSILIPNPLASNTYTLKLFGPNPAYQAPAPVPSTLDIALSLGATVYVYGFANGMTYQNNVGINTSVNLTSLCTNATWFNLVQTSTSTFSKATCLDTLNTLTNWLYQLDLSTPTVIPPEP